MTRDELLRLIDQAADEGWTSLDLSNQGLTELPSEIGKLMSLKNLRLGRNQLSKLPYEFRQLTNLKSLDLTSNQFSEFPYEIPELPNMSGLYFSANRLTTLPPEIGKFTKLKRFFLDANHLTMLPPEIGELTNLTTLILNANQLTTLPPEIKKIPNLRHLNLKNNLLPLPYEIIESKDEADKIIKYYFQQDTIENKAIDGQKWRKNIPIQQLLEDAARNHVKYLDLSNKGLNILPPEIGKLTDLTEMILSFNDLTTLPKEIQNLKKLKKLDLRFNQITAFPPEIVSLTSLTKLHLGVNQLTSLPAHLEKLTSLKVLKLWYNNLITFPLEICKLKNLTELSISNNRFTTIPKEILTLKNLTALDLRGNPLPIPPEILNRYDQPPQILNYYFQHVEKPKKPINEAKVIIVGQGAVGKTSLVKRLLEDEFNPYETKTDGIAINQWHVNFDNTNIRLNLWDFGGQEIMHATHQFFLTKRSLYLLVLDSRLDEQENRVEYWLKMIQSFGGDSPILVVCNKCDEHDLELNWKGLQDKYPTIRAFARQVSCKTGAGIADLRRLIEQEAGQLPHIHDELILSWFAVKTELEEMPDDYISYNQYRQICAEQEVDDELSQQTLLGFLHDLGIVLHFHDHPMLEDTNVLNPEWVTRGVYQLLNSNELFQSKGELERGALDHILDPQSYPRAKHQFILDMMRTFELCFDFAEYAGERFLVPDLLSKEEPYTGDWEESLGFQYHYDILPGSVMSRFIVRMHAYIFKKTYWRHGVVLASTNGKNKALAKADLEERKIFIHVAGRESTRHVFLEIIRADFHKIHRTISKLKVKEKVPIPKHPEIIVDYEHLLALEELGEEYLIPEGLKIKVSVRQLLHGIQPQPTPGVGESLSPTVLQPTPDPSQEGNLPHTYFLSYSWKNSSEADHLELVLSRQQRTILRDETNIEAGGRVSSSVENMIHQADTFVALWNEHYAHSDWCPNELEYARTRQVRGEKPSRIVLIALDQTEIPIRFIDTLRLSGQDRGQRELAIQRLIKEEAVSSRKWAFNGIK